MEANSILGQLGITHFEEKDAEWNVTGSTIRLVYKENSHSRLEMQHFPKEMDLEILINKNACLKMELLAMDKEISGKIHIILKENATLDAAMADFSSSNNLEVLVDLEEAFSDAIWHLAAISRKNDKKVFNINFNHLTNHTTSLMSNCGVVEDTSMMRFCGVSWIAHNAKKSKAIQQAKMMVFDEKCRAIANPILKIDENDIEASHACAVGKVSDEQMFYLTSRGIHEQEAKQLITFGYIKPIIAYFEDKTTKEKIIQEMERGIQ